MPEASPPPPPPLLPPLTLAVGDRVVYPNQGICHVTSVASKKIAGQTLKFVTLKREEDGAVVMVPEGKVRAIGVRRVSNKGDVEAVFEFLKSESDKATLDWKQRARTNLDRMNTGGLLGLAEVVKGLQVLSELRPLPTKERELYDNARHLLVAEIAASLGIAECDGEDAIDIVLFPPGRERPKRTVEEFRPELGEEDELGELGDDLMGLGGELELPPEEEPSAEDEGTPEDEKEKPLKKRGKKKAPAQPAKVAAPPPPKRKRGRPRNVKPVEAAPPPAPKKRGRPPKAKPAAAAPPRAPKKRGRPSKAKAVAPPAKGRKK